MSLHSTPPPAGGMWGLNAIKFLNILPFTNYRSKHPVDKWHINIFFAVGSCRCHLSTSSGGRPTLASVKRTWTAGPLVKMLNFIYLRPTQKIQLHEKISLDRLFRQRLQPGYLIAAPDFWPAHLHQPRVPEADAFQ